MMLVTIIKFVSNNCKSVQLQALQYI